MTDDDVILTGSIGRSNIKVPEEMSIKEILAKYEYGENRSWSGNICYYVHMESRAHYDYLGFIHTPTGIIFSFTNTRNNKVGTTIYNVNNTKTERKTWQSGLGYNGYSNMMDSINAVDSELANWNVVRMEISNKVRPFVGEMYLSSGSNPPNANMPKGDLSALFSVTETLQKGMVDVSERYDLVAEAIKIEETNEIEEMVI